MVTLLRVIAKTLSGTHFELRNKKRKMDRDVCVLLYVHAERSSTCYSSQVVPQAS